MKFKKLTATMLAFMMSISLYTNAFSAENESDRQNINPYANMSEEYISFDIISQYISQFYIDDTLDKETVMKQGISEFLKSNPDLLVPLLKKTFESLDDYSEFFTAEEYQEYENSVNQVFYGIGVSIQKNGDYVEIVGFAEENSAAQKAGFEVGDKIYAVNGEVCKGKSLNDVRNLIVGKLNTTVDVTVLRNDQLTELTATRVEVKQSTVTGGVFEGNVGYIKVSTFGNTTAGEFEVLLNDFREKNVKKVILDLRDNGGGRLDTAVEMAKQIVPKGKIIDVVYRDSKYDVTYFSELAHEEFDLITLVNENTASSAEILASAIQDSKAGKLLGTTTYGKGVVQTVFPLENGMKFKLTIAQYKTRNGKEINHIGLAPDEYVENTTKRIDVTEYIPFDFRTRLSMGDCDTKVIAAKERLSLLNYFAGKTDDTVFNDDLRIAVEAFQKDNNLCANGVLDIATQVKIEELFEKLEILVDLQMQEAYKLFGGNPDVLYKN